MKKLVVGATVTLELDMNEPIKSGKRVMKTGEIPVEFIEHDLRQIIEQRLGRVIKLTEFVIQHMEVK